jgi:Ser/Thr protein kinase RdoA (MazF antagonist)
MMPLPELARLAATLDAAGRCPVADEVAARWGYPAGTARHHRSSASHVFTVDGAYLRFVPAWYRSRDRVEAVALGQAACAEAGLAVAPPLPSTAGKLVETVETGSGQVYAMVVRAAAGERWDAGALTPSRARAWGASLARVHRDGRGDGLPEWFGELAGFGARCTRDPELAAAVDRVAAALAEIPRDESRYGFVHGDYELDNIAWVGDTGTAFDFDEAGQSWFAADIAAAVWELGSGPGFASSRANAASSVEVFVAGYRSVRPLPDADLARLPLFQAAHAAVWLARLRGVWGHGRGPIAGVDWIPGLRRRIAARARSHRARVLAAVHAVPPFTGSPSRVVP